MLLVSELLSDQDEVVGQELVQGPEGLPEACHDFSACDENDQLVRIADDGSIPALRVYHKAQVPSHKLQLLMVVCNCIVQKVRILLVELKAHEEALVVHLRRIC